MKDRLKAVRKAIGLTQQEFADDLNLRQSTIASYESGDRVPSARTVADVCRTYGVNIDWLQTGEGEMFRASTRAEQIAAFVGEALADEPESTRQRLLYALTRIPDKGWQLLDAFLDDLAAPPPGKKE